MADIRLTQPRGGRLWTWIGVIVVLGVALWASVYVFGDPTNPKRPPGVGDKIGAGDQRAPVIPAEAVPFQAIAPPRTRDLGRLIHVSGTAETASRGNALLVRTPGDYRILVRFEPPPAAGELRRFFPGAAVSLDGYLSRVSREEFDVWMDTLGVSLPRPPPGRKFGDLPDPAFQRVDSLFIKTFYVSVRPRALENPGGAP
ncbi:MAG TPA: hypothetical protein VFL93_04830 [Longimicrobiaceae bacterium]|nr:hypothetical protein [Longimicrobiaceae bacterium]